MSDALERAQELDQYFTRPALAKAVVEWANIQPGARVLEPSCGEGALVRWIPDSALVTAIDLDDEMLSICRGLRQDTTIVWRDFLKYPASSDAYDIAVMNPPYGYVGSGKVRQAADRLHVQHALRMCPEVICLVRANFLWGQERYNHVLRFARVVRMAVLVHRPSFHGPAVAVDGKGGQHEMMVLHLERRPDRALSSTPECVSDQTRLEYWTQDWRIDP